MKEQFVSATRKKLSAEFASADANELRSFLLRAFDAVQKYNIMNPTESKPLRFDSERKTGETDAQPLSLSQLRSGVCPV